jgi:hypothetical protein
MKHVFVRCVVCDTPYVDEKEPYLCERCQANGVAAETIKRLNTETDNAAAEIARLTAAMDEAREIYQGLDKEMPLSGSEWWFPREDYPANGVPSRLIENEEMVDYWMNRAARWLAAHPKP